MTARELVDITSIEVKKADTLIIDTEISKKAQKELEF
jgi:hypothetical protein